MFPAQALAAALESRGRELALVTDRRGADSGVPEGFSHVYTVRAAGVSGRGVVGRVRGIAEIVIGVVQARRRLRRLRPAGVVGFGGYASVPAVLAASGLGLPTVIHEQNAVLGRANRLLASRAGAIATGFADTARLSAAARAKAEHTGNPVRAAVAEIGNKPYPALEPDGTLALLVTGGSQGAEVMSGVVPAALASLPEAMRLRLRVAQQCREVDLARVRAIYEKAGIAADLAPFFDDLPARLAAAHLVVARAGASTVAEITAAGRPAILVPFPFATDDHQLANARAVEAAGGAWTMAQAGFAPATLATRLEAFLVRPSRLAEAAANARAIGIPRAAARLADLVERHIPGARDGSRRAPEKPAVRGLAA
jgi:UDP-N-acetylglucosamine--N-acetylmuramyl-(pentapeptide) pyrophosphoryl-undecaprenol N-acetylglucosamine transferase